LETASLKYKFYHPLRVRYVDTDAQQRVFFSNYLTYFDIALTEYMRTIGYTYQDMVTAGVDMFHIKASCQYKGPARFDDVLHVHTHVAHIGNASLGVEFAIYKQPDDELIATGRIVTVAVDVETEKPIRVPNALREAVARFEGKTTTNLE